MEVPLSQLTSALRNHYSDVVLSLAAAEALDRVYYGLEQVFRFHSIVGLRQAHEPRLSELLASITECFGHPIRVNDKRIARFQVGFRNHAVPICKEAEYRRSCRQALDSALATQEKGR